MTTISKTQQKEDGSLQRALQCMHGRGKQEGSVYVSGDRQKRVRAFESTGERKTECVSGIIYGNIKCYGFELEA